MVLSKNLVVVDSNRGSFFSSLAAKYLLVHPFVFLGTRLDVDTGMNLRTGRIALLSLGSSVDECQQHLSVVGLKDEPHIQDQPGFVVVHCRPVRRRSNNVSVKVLEAGTALKLSAGVYRDTDTGSLGAIGNHDGGSDLELDRKDNFQFGSGNVWVR